MYQNNNIIRHNELSAEPIRTDILQVGVSLDPDDLYKQFEEFIDRSPATERAYRINFRQFVAWMRYAGIDQPTRQDIIAYREWLQSEHEAIELDPTPKGWRYRLDANGDRIVLSLKPATITEYIRAVCMVYKWASLTFGTPDIGVNIHKPKIDTKHKKDYLTPEQVCKIEDNIAVRSAEKIENAAECTKDTNGHIQRSGEQGKRLYAMYLLAVNCGMRCVELSRADIKDIEVKDGQAYIYIWGKGHAEADTKKAVVPEVKAAVDDYLASRTDHYTGTSPLFVSTGNRSGGKRIAPNTISTMLKQALREAGYDSNRLTAHSLRHTAGQGVMEVTDNNIFETQLYMRHSSPTTTEHYLEKNDLLQDTKIARELYDLYHNGHSQSEDEDGEQTT